MRFTDEKKWSDKWFRSLRPCHKIVWIYICDSCDIAGFYEVDIESISFHTKLTEDESRAAIEGLSRGYLGADGYIWIKNFLKHQNNHLLNPSNNCHKGIIKRIQMNLSLFPSIPEILGADKGLFSPTSKGRGKGKSNCKSKSKASVPPKSVENRQQEFKEQVKSKWEDLGGESYMPKTEAHSFFNWWSETNSEGEMKAETMEFFEIGKRLSSWRKKIQKSNPNVRRNA